MKRYMNAALLYAILAMVGGVFYREFTKFQGFTGKTTLSVVHTHYFLLGMVFFLMLLLLEKDFSFTGAKTGRAVLVYHIGLNLTSVMFVLRGIASAGNPAFLRDECRHFRYCRNRAHSAGHQSGSFTDSGKTRCICPTGLNSKSSPNRISP